MTISFEKDIRHRTVRSIAEKMLIAARTAPKGRGEDNTVCAIVDGIDIQKISDTMKEMGKSLDHPGFIRDAENILNAEVLLLFGTKIKNLGLRICGLCGFKDCAEKNEHPTIPCAFNTGDLGIAMGSAVSVAMDHRVDNRIMYSVGLAVIELGLLGNDVKIVYGVPLSATPKNPFFDRK